MEMALEQAQSELADLNKRFALLKDRLEDEEAKNAELEATLAEREQSLTALDEEVRKRAIILMPIKRSSRKWLH